jgi:translation initiation factor 3 subunit M
MTEEDQILGVVRFVAELIWEDTEPTVSDAEINKVCDDAHRHVLAGQWLDIASLLLKSTDFFSLGVAEEGRTIPELQCFPP